MELMLERGLFYCACTVEKSPETQAGYADKVKADRSSVMGSELLLEKARASSLPSRPERQTGCRSRGYGNDERVALLLGRAVRRHRKPA